MLAFATPTMNWCVPHVPQLHRPTLLVSHNACFHARSAYTAPMPVNRAGAIKMVDEETVPKVGSLALKDGLDGALTGVDRKLILQCA